MPSEKEKELCMNQICYLNNAATSFPKPDCVAQAVQKAVESLPPGQLRSGGTGAADDVFDDCREMLGRLLGIADTGRIAFSSGATESLNLILKGLAIPADQVITTVTEHNSVLRPLYNLPGIAGKPVLLPCDGNGLVDPADFEREASLGKTRAVILNHCSNVTGAIQDAAAFGQIAKRFGLLFILDTSQSAGCMEVKADEWQVDAMAFTGHKSLLGISGTGGYYVRKGVPYVPGKFGGTGRESDRLLYRGGIDEWEAGTRNTVGAAALKASAGWILRQGVEQIRISEDRLGRLAADMLSDIRGMKVYGKDLKNRGPVLSFSFDRLPPSDLSYILNSSYRIVTRSGLHCSPLIHSYTGSGPAGTVRISFSPFSVPEQIEKLRTALEEIEKWS